MHVRAISLSLALLLATPFAATAQDADSMFSFSGFGTVGAVHNSEDQADFATDFGPDGAGHSDSWSANPDSRLGLQLDARFTERFSAVVQVLSEYDYEGSHEPDLTLAHVKYAFSPALSVRVGRLVAPTFMLSDYRKVGYAMPWLRPPVEVYNNYIEIDGGERFVQGAIRWCRQAGLVRERRAREDLVEPFGGAQIGFRLYARRQQRRFIGRCTKLVEYAQRHPSANEQRYREQYTP